VRSLVALAALALGSVCAAPAAAALRLTPGTVTPASISFPRPAPLVYTLQLTAVGQNETFRLEVAPPPFGSGEFPGGMALDFAGPEPTLDGPAVVTGRASRIAGTPICGTHGFPGAGRAWDVRVPAGTTSTLSLALKAARFSPWPTTSYDVTFRAQPRLVAGVRGTLAAAQEVTVDGPAATGRRGVQIALRTRPATTHPALSTKTRVRPGRRIALRGTTRPALAGHHVSLWVSSDDGFRFARRLPTDGRGRFRAELRARPGLAFLVRSPRVGNLDADHTCPLGFDVRS
jgi:hypothetical protein